MRNYLTSLLFLFIVAYSSVAQDTIRVSDFGATPYSYENSVKAFQKAIEACKRQNAKVLVIDSGRYDLWTEGAERRVYYISNTSRQDECPDKTKTIGLLFEKVKDLTIEGNNALIMCHGKMITYAFDHCENIQMKNLHFDFSRPSMSEFKCVRSEEGITKLEAHRDTEYEIVNQRILLFGEGWRSRHYHCIEYDGETDMGGYANQVWSTLLSSPVKEKTTGHLVFSTPKEFKMKEGNVLTVRDIIRDQVGAFIYESTNITLSHVGMHYMHGLGIVSQFSKNIIMDSVTCAPRPESGRIMASSADFMHFSGCSGKVKVEGCYFSGAHDDPINIHGTNLRIVEKKDNRTLRLQFMHGQSYGFDAFFPGDTVAFITPHTMQRYATTQIVSSKAVSEHEVEVSLASDAPAEVEIGMDCLENITHTPEVEIRGNYFTRTNTRGTLCTTPRRVIIENNTYVKTGMPAILIESDSQFWFESGPVSDMTIRNNTFIDCCHSGGPGDAVIAFNPSNDIVNDKTPVHRNVRIENNVFKTFDAPILYAKSVGGLTFKNNQVEATQTISRRSSNRHAVYLNGCSNVVVRNNRFAENTYSKSLFFEHMTKRNVKSDLK